MTSSITVITIVAFLSLAAQIVRERRARYAVEIKTPGDEISRK